MLRAITLFLAVAAGAFSVEQLWHLLHDPVSRWLAAPGQPSEPVRPHRDPVVLPAGWTPAPPLTPTAPALTTANARITNSSRTLVLIDTAPAQNARDGTARLGTDALDAQTYVAGAILVNGTRLAEIYSNYVVLERGNQTVRLYVQGNGQPGRLQEGSLLDVGESSPLLDNQLPVGSAGEDLRTAAVSHYIRANPVFEANQLRGFALNPGAQPMVYSRLGLVPGDVVTAINGVGIRDGEQVFEMLEQVTAGERVDVTVERGGQLQRLTLDGSVITAAHPEASVAEPPGPP
jgi:hypothetical protein